MSAGADPSSVHIVCARRMGCRATAGHLERLLAKTDSAGRGAIGVATPFEAACRLLEEESAATGARAPRPILDAELPVVLCDARVPRAQGVRVVAAAGRALRAGADPAGTLPAADVPAWQAVARRLNELGACLPEGVFEAASQACTMRPALASSHTIVCDAEKIGPAGMALCRTLWGTVETVCEEDAQAEPTVGGDAPATCELVRWETPEEECSGLAAYVQRLVEADPTLAPSDVAIAAPTPGWARAMARALYHRRFDVDVAWGRQGVGGDLRDAGRCADLAAFTALRLALDDSDALSWRVWCALGDASLRRDEWAAMESAAGERGMTAVDALLAAARRTDPDLAAICPASAARCAELLPVLDRLREQRGFALVRELYAGTGGSDPGWLANEIDGDEDLAAVGRLMEARAFDNEFDQRRNHVRVGSYDNVAELVPRVAVMGGLAEGLVPSAGALRAHAHGEDGPLAEQHRAFEAIRTGTRNRLVMSIPHGLVTARAERAGIAPRRTRIEGSTALAIMETSRFVEELGDGAPPLQGGSLLLNELGVR